MTVKELKEILADSPDDMRVLVMLPNPVKPGMFAFTEACTCDTGISELGPGPDGHAGGESVFLVLPHGFGSAEEEDEVVPEMN